MAISRDDLDQHGLIIGVSPERFRAVAMPLLFDHLSLIHISISKPLPAGRAWCRLRRKARA